MQFFLDLHSVTGKKKTLSASRPPLNLSSPIVWPTMASSQHQCAGALSSLTTIADQFWDEALVELPQGLAGSGWTADEVVDEGAATNPSASRKKSSPPLQKFAPAGTQGDVALGRRRGAQSPAYGVNTETAQQVCNLTPPDRRAPPPLRRYIRSITSTTALRFLHIPADMHRELGLGDMYPTQPGGRRDNAVTVHLVSGAINAAVIMLRTTSIRQHHRRFSTGWRDFCARLGVEIGDDLMFEREVGTGNDLAVSIVKGRLNVNTT